MITSQLYRGLGLVLVIAVAVCKSASIKENLVYETARINNGDELVSSVINDCFTGETISCLKGKVLTYLDTQLNVNQEYARSFDNKNVDEVIYERVARLLSTSEFRVQLPETLFSKTIVTYNGEKGFDFEVPKEEARGDLLKKKLLLPVLLLLKLKMKALMPIFVALIGLKALKALILSKLAIGVVLGFVIYQLVMKKSAMGMAMAPMTESPMTAYGAPLPTSSSSSSSSSYDPSSWDSSSSSSGGPYARIWEPSSSSSQLAYSSYYPSSSSSSSGSGSSASITSSSSTSTGSGSSHSSYSS